MNPLAHLYRIVTTHKTWTAAILAAVLDVAAMSERRRGDEKSIS
jgi:hypothetical protein